MTVNCEDVLRRLETRKRGLRRELEVVRGGMKQSEREVELLTRELGVETKNLQFAAYVTLLERMGSPAAAAAVKGRCGDDLPVLENSQDMHDAAAVVRALNTALRLVRDNCATAMQCCELLQRRHAEAVIAGCLLRWRRPVRSQRDPPTAVVASASTTAATATATA